VIRVENLHVRVGAFALEDIELQVPEGGYAILMGKTGSGKTTLLEAIAGLKPVESGRIVLAQVDVTRRRPAERGIGYVPQDGALFANMTVRQHLAFALVVRKVPVQAQERRIEELAEWLDISDLLRRRPGGLSGGERQRVALGRALSFEPRLLLLDEPLSALDDATRAQMYDVLHRMREYSGVTTLHVTHNREDAEELADTVFHLEAGHIRPTRSAETRRPVDTAS
jgi:ABC-type sugar transport system ATPase subunit